MLPWDLLHAFPLLQPWERQVLPELSVAPCLSVICYLLGRFPIQILTLRLTCVAIISCCKWGLKAPAVD